MLDFVDRWRFLIVASADRDATVGGLDALRLVFG